MNRLPFRIDGCAEGSRARATTLRTAHGTVTTPMFMPVGTQATVRTQTRHELETAGAQVLLANTYHLLFRPGLEVFRRFGGIHRFMAWPGPVLTDSGGFQIFSLPDARHIHEEGAEFRHALSGERLRLTPEASIEAQQAIGSDIIMALDHCVPSSCDHATALDAVERTTRWAERSLAAHAGSERSRPRASMPTADISPESAPAPETERESGDDYPRALFGIIQGACFPDLRRLSSSQLTGLPFDGFAIGGLAVGETRAQREDFTALTSELLPVDRPRYLMGVGTPIDLLEAVHRGVDMFDCILPTAMAQQGLAFTSEGKVHLRRTAYQLSEEPLDPGCRCATCRTFSRAYLHHLIKGNGGLGWQLVSTHNLYFYLQLMREMRAAILDGAFSPFYRDRRGRLDRSDTDATRAPGRTKRDRHPLHLGAYEVVLSPTGPAAIRHVASGEVMHPTADPMEEARRLYVGQSRLHERLSGVPSPVPADGAGRLSLDDGRENEPEGAHVTSRSPLVVWDVGLGAATNAMAALQAGEDAARALSGTRQAAVDRSEHEPGEGSEIGAFAWSDNEPGEGSEIGAATRTNPAASRAAQDVDARVGLRPLHLVSFERDLDALRLALIHPERFPYLNHAAPHALIRAGTWQSKKLPIRWTLLEGDFLERLEAAPPPDLIFYDPFSFRTDSPLWTPACFARLFAHLDGRAVELYTYSRATTVRAALLAAGFYLARGIPSGPKSETTIALTPAAVAGRPDLELLGPDWLRKWEGSRSQGAAGLSGSEAAAMLEAVRSHPQLRRSS